MKEENYKIPIGGEWFLDDLYTFPRTYEQVYHLYFSLMPQKDERIVERITRAYSVFPWEGGYSAVNFYDSLKYLTPKGDRPQIVSMQYASPGWIELSVILGVALAVEKIIKSVSHSIKEGNDTYHHIYRQWQERKILAFKSEEERLKLEQKYAEQIEREATTMSKLLGFENVQQMTAITGSHWKTVKILLSLYRRVRTLAEFQEKGKTRF